MRFPWILAIAPCIALSAFLPQDLRAERATEEQMHRACENWLAYVVHQRGGWAGARDPEIVDVQGIVEDGVLLARCYSIAPSGHVVVPVLKELPPIKAYSEDYGVDVSQTVGYPQLLRDVLAHRIRLFIDAFGSLDVRQGVKARILFDPVNREEWDRFLLERGRFDEDLDRGSLGTLTTVGPLLTSAWHQDIPYNNLCPMGDGDRCLVGCVATAAAQVMKYHEWPLAGTGDHEYYWNGDQSCGGNVGGGYLQADFSDAYDWPNIPDDCEGGCSSAEEDALAELCYEVGVAFDMDYGACGSGTWTHYALTVFPTYFNYEEDIDRENRADHTPETWFAIIQDQINSSRPMMYRIEGHAIVCDGWQDTGGLNQYHMNYGWGGSHNSWYTLDNLYGSPDPMDEYLIRNITPKSWLALVKPDGSGDYPTIQAAIDSVPSGYIIELADGTFTGVGNRDIEFRGKILIVRSQSGDADQCIIDCQNLGRGFYFHSGEGEGALLDAVSVTGGYASGASPADRGGGILCESASPTIRDCKIVGNTADGFGGGICCDSSSVTITGSTVSGNHAGIRGGGIAFLGPSAPAISGLTISGNTAGTAGGGMFCQSTPVITGCAVTGNHSASHGGGFCFSDSVGPEPPMYNCTVSGNHADSTGGGVWCEGSAAPAFQMTIVWNNCAAGQGDEVYLKDVQSSVSFACSDVDSLGIEGPGSVAWQWYNLSIDPGFCGPVGCASAPSDSGDYHIKDISPCAPAQSPPVCDLIGALDVGCTSQIVTVRPDGNGDFPTIQDAIDATPSWDTIELTDGTFTGPGNRDLDLRGKALTIRSQSGRPDSCVLDCQGTARGFYLHSGERAETVIEGITIANGQAARGAGMYLSDYASPSVIRCVFAVNSADSAGGAVYAGDQAAPSLDSCTFWGNSSPSGGGLYASGSSPSLANTIVAFAAQGAAVSCDSTGGAVLTCCDLYGNAGGDWVGCVQAQDSVDGNFSADPLFCDPDSGDYSLDSGSPCVDAPGCGLVGALGVGCFGNRVWHVPADAPTIQAGIDSASAGDTVLVESGTYYEYDITMKSGVCFQSETGEADCVTIDAQDQSRVLYCEGVDSTATIRGFTITGGNASAAWPGNWGGGMFLKESSPRIENCYIFENSATANGGGLCFWDHCAPVLSNCTLQSNSAPDYGGGIYAYYYCSPRLENCIVAFSTEGEGVYCYFGTTASLSCCDVYANAGGDWVGCLAGQDTVNGNFCDDPRFCEPFTGHVAIASPCAPENSPPGCGLVGALGVGCETTPVAEAEVVKPTRFHLAPNVPNPFNPLTEITYGIPASERPSRVTLTIYDALGRGIRTLVDADQGPGTYTVLWEGKDHKGAEVASGVYFYRLVWKGRSETRRMVLLK